MESKTKEMIFSFVLAILGIYVFAEGIAIYYKAAGLPYRITQFTISPGFLPVILGALLFFFSILLFVSTIKGEKEGAKAVFLRRLRETGAWFRLNSKNKDIAFTIGAVAIMAIYTYILMELLPFWAASVLFLLALFFYLRSGKWWKNIIVAVLAEALVVIVFQYCFNAALP